MIKSYVFRFVIVRGFNLSPFLYWHTSRSCNAQIATDLRLVSRCYWQDFELHQTVSGFFFNFSYDVHVQLIIRFIYQACVLLFSAVSFVHIRSHEHYRFSYTWICVRSIAILIILAWDTTSTFLKYKIFIVITPVRYPPLLILPYSFSFFQESGRSDEELKHS